MSRPPRGDGPDTWHHVMNRGLARRTIFENDADIRFYMSRLARAVKRDAIEVHAFTFLPTHFHLLIRSLRGELSQSMMWIQNQYVRWFNRRRKRDGPLFRGRFWSNRITSMNYWRVVVHYIDNNAVDAHIAGRSDQYPYCSAHYYTKALGPTWMTRKTIEEEVTAAMRSPKYLPEDYLAVFGQEASPDQSWLVERRMKQFAPGKDPLDYLVKSAPPAVRRWMIRKATLADGKWREYVVASPKTLKAVMASFINRDPEWKVKPNGVDRSGWKIMMIGLLRNVSGLRLFEISRRAEVTDSSVSRALIDHKNLMMSNDDYSQRATLILQETLKAAFA